MVSNIILLHDERNQGSLEKWLILGLGQNMYKMSLEHLVVPESKGVLKKQKAEKPYCDGATSKSHGNQLKELPMDKSGNFWAKSKVLLIFNPK